MLLKDGRPAENGSAMCFAYSTSWTGGLHVCRDKRLTEKIKQHSDDLATSQDDAVEDESPSACQQICNILTVKPLLV